MDAGDDFAWNTRDDATDTDNGYVCKKRFDFDPVKKPDVANVTGILQVDKVKMYWVRDKLEGYPSSLSLTGSR